MTPAETPSTAARRSRHCFEVLKFALAYFAAAGPFEAFQFWARAWPRIISEHMARSAGWLKPEKTE